MTDQQILSLGTKNIFFGHQSVGDNIVDGMRDLTAADPRLKIKIVTSADPQSVPGFAFTETHIGQNRDPQSKNKDFAAILDRGFGRRGGIALYKYCYVDFSSSTNVQQVFDDYRSSIAELKQKYPLLVIVHSTVPLTTEERSDTVKDQAWNALRRIGGRDPNVKRNEYNQLLRQAYGGKDPIFDIAEVESTHSDGSRSYCMRGIRKIYTLAPEFTNDGGHLNESGRRLAAERLLLVLSSLRP